ncbi:MAG: endospore germination permease [Clostridia bacterium]|nr:endospore germination permease [Clostridia bacterium]
MPIHDGRDEGRREAASTGRKKEEILYLQVVVLAAQLVFATGFLAAARVLTPVAGCAAWISVIVGWAIGIAIAFIAGALIRRFPTLSVVEMAEDVFTIPLGKAIGFSFAVYCTVILAISSKQFVLAISIPFLQSTPTEIVSGVFFALLAYATYLGIEPIARVSLIFFTIVVLSLIMLTGLAVPVSVPGRLLPLLGKGPMAILRGGMLYASYVGELIVVLAFIRSMRKQDISRVHIALASGVTIGSVLMALSVSFGLMMLGHYAMARLTFPAVEIARMVGVGEFLERTEILFLALWFSVALLKSATVFYASVASAAEVMNLTDYRPLVLPYGVFTMALSLLPENIMESFSTLGVFLKYSGWYALGLPALMLTVAAIRHRGGKSRGGREAGATS